MANEIDVMKVETTDVNDESAPVQRGLMTKPDQVLAFMFGGEATLTFKSKLSGNHYTYCIKAGKITEAEKAEGKKAPYFVYVMWGSDNENDYKYMGMISFWQGVWSFRLTKKSFENKLTDGHKQVLAFRWAFDAVINGAMPRGVEIWHEGRCSRCHRKLSDPVSIEQGFGPFCLKVLGGDAGIARIAETFVTKVDGHKTSLPSPAVSRVQRQWTPATIVEFVNADPRFVDQMVQVNLEAKNKVVIDPTLARNLAKSQGWSNDEALVVLEAETETLQQKGV